MNSSPFNRIPAELRNKIYELALVQSVPVKLDLAQTGTQLKACRRSGPRKLLALTETCKQIRHEAMAVFAEKTTFRIFARKMEYTTMTRAQKRTVNKRADSLAQWAASLRRYTHHELNITIDLCRRGLYTDINQLKNLARTMAAFQTSFRKVEVKVVLRTGGSGVAAVTWSGGCGNTSREAFMKEHEKTRDGGSSGYWVVGTIGHWDQWWGLVSPMETLGEALDGKEKWSWGSA